MECSIGADLPIICMNIIYLIFSKDVSFMAGTLVELMQVWNPLVITAKYFPSLVIIHETQDQWGVTSFSLSVPYFWSTNRLWSNTSQWIINPAWILNNYDPIPDWKYFDVAGNWKWNTYGWMIDVGESLL